ncbi:hypothetical protein Taro_021913 [Colocasia esculenta]|uniref:Uncharacterized protein n=1 Tax=Colocasia esculenta TaxID=4460 RepID=A0A843USW1_COLES|nr:hypothetical protein [Colocasia esculenta]
MHGESSRCPSGIYYLTCSRGGSRSRDPRISLELEPSESLLPRLI